MAANEENKSVSLNEGVATIRDWTLGKLGNYLPLSGGKVNGDLILNEDPTADLQAATKQYVDRTASTVITNEQVDAMIEKALNRVTVSFYNGSTLLKTVSVNPGENADYGDTSSLKSDRGGDFLAWDPEPTNVQDDMICNATFQTKYKVDFYNGETLLKTVYVNPGEDADYGDTSDITAPEGQEFDVWSPVPTNVQEDLKCTATFKETTSAT